MAGDFLNLQDDFFERLEIVNLFHGIQLQRIQDTGQASAPVAGCGFHETLDFVSNAAYIFAYNPGQENFLAPEVVLINV